MKAHPASAVDEARDYLAKDAGGLGSGACSLLGSGAGPANYAALGRIIRAGIEALGPEQAEAEVIEMARRSRR
jgi:hypothetical protein